MLTAFGRMPLHVVKVPTTVAELVAKSLCTSLQSFCIGARIRKSLDNRPQFPPPNMLQKWLRQSKRLDGPPTLASAAVQDTGEADALRQRPFLRLPGGGGADALPHKKSKTTGPTQLQKTHDPINVFRHLKFSQNLKDLRNVNESLGDAAECLMDGDDDEVAKLLQRKPDASSRSTLLEARKRLDSTSMLLERREMHHFPCIRGSWRACMCGRTQVLWREPIYKDKSC